MQRGPVTELVESILDLPGPFVDVATNDPLSALLLLAGFGFLAVASAVMGYLTLGAAVDFVTPT